MEAQTLYGDEVGGAIVPVEDGDFMTELARQVLEGAELADLQSLFADEMQVSPSTLDFPAEAIPVQVPLTSQSWEEWRLLHKARRNIRSGRSSRRASGAQPGQLSLWSTEKRNKQSPIRIRLCTLRFW